MKLNIDPMPLLRESKTIEINNRFNRIASDNLHRDHAHNQKREWAKSQDQRLLSEATLRGITVAELSALILSKPDRLAESELQRQEIIKRITAATSPVDLDAI